MGSANQISVSMRYAANSGWHVLRIEPTYALHHCDFSRCAAELAASPCAGRSSPLPPTTFPTTSPTQSLILSCSTPPFSSTRSPNDASTSSRFRRMRDLFLFALRR